MSKKFVNFRKRMGQTAITIALVGASVVSASAASKEAVTTANLNMRTGEGKSHQIVETIKKGEKVQVLEDEGSWWRVKHNGKEGYSYKTYLKVVNNKPVVQEGKVDVGNSRLNVRTSANTSAKIVGKLVTGDKVQITGQSGNWYEINYKGEARFVSKEFVKNVSNTGNNGETSKPEAMNKTMEVTASSLNVREKATTSSRVLGQLKEGSKVTVVERTSNGWAKISYNGKTAYVSMSYLRETAPSEGQVEVIGKAKVKTNGTNLNVRKGPGTHYEVVTKAKSGQVIELVQQKSRVAGWQLVKVNGVVGYVAVNYIEVIEEVKPEPPVTPENPGTPEVKPEPPVTPEEKPENPGTPEEKPEPPVTPEEKPEPPVTPPVEPPVTPEEKPEPPIENQAPIITIFKDTLELTVGDKYDRSMIDAMFDVVDPDERDFGDSLLITIDDSSVDTSKAGSYEVKITAEDADGAKDNKSIFVVVKDKEVTPPPVDPGTPPTVINNVPVIVLRDTLELTVGDKFDNSMLNAVATDKEDGVITDKIVITGTVDTTKAGSYELTVKVTDSKGASKTEKATVVVREASVENQAPTLIVKEDLKLKVGDKFEESMLEIVATDKEDGNLSSSVVIEGNVDTSKEGTYKLVITVADSKGLTATKTVNVVVSLGLTGMNSVPEIASVDELVLEVGDKYDPAMLNVVCTDKEDGNLTGIIEGDRVDTSKAGVYNVVVRVNDSQGATVRKTIKVTVKEKAVNNAPTITAKEDLKIAFGGEFNVEMLEIVATDKEDGKLTPVVTGNVDTNKSGTYEITIVATDSKGLSTTKKVNVVVEKQQTPPSIINEVPVLTVENVTINVKDAFNNGMLNISSIDKEDGDISSKAVVTGTVDTNKVGSYKLTIVSTDSKGAKSTKEATVTVKATNPVVTGSNVTITQGDAFNNSMVKASGTDCEGKNLNVTITGNVDANTPGSYTLTLKVTDQWGLTATKNVTVTVEKKVQTGITNPNSSEFKSMVASQMYSLVNSHRAANGLAPYQTLGRLEGMANAWSKHMADNNFFDHTDHNGNFADEAFPQFGLMSQENIAMSILNPKDVYTQEDARSLANSLFNMWKNSAGHNAAMLSTRNQTIGFGFHVTSSGTVYATQEFFSGTKSIEETTEDTTVEAPPVVEEKPEVEAPPVVEETPEVEAPVEKPEVEAPPVVEEEPEVEAPPVVEEAPQEPSVEMEDTTEATVEMN